MNRADIRRMSTAERLQTMEALWDELLHEDADIDSPKWHEEVLETRRRKVETGEGEFLSLDELKASRDS